MTEPIRQQGTLERLVAIVERGRLAHGYVFIGEPGIGKRETALAFARALLCSQPERGHACGGCSACTRTERLTHPDLHLLTPENRLIKVEAIRELQESMGLKTYEGGRRLVIVEDADAMNESAANAFLKTLEEPPPGTVVVLITARPELLPATILSRAQPVRFRPLPWQAVRNFVEQRGLTDAERRVRLAEGRLDVAAREDLVEFRETVERQVSDLLREDPDVKEIWPGRDEALAWMDALYGAIRDEIIMEVTKTTDFIADPRGAPRIPTPSSDDRRVRELLALARDMKTLRNQLRFNLSLAVSLQWVGLRLRGEQRAA